MITRKFIYLDNLGLGEIVQLRQWQNKGFKYIVYDPKEKSKVLSRHKDYALAYYQIRYSGHNGQMKNIDTIFAERHIQ